MVEDGWSYSSKAMYFSVISQALANFGSPLRDTFSTHVAQNFTKQINLWGYWAIQTIFDPLPMFVAEKPSKMYFITELIYFKTTHWSRPDPNHETVDGMQGWTCQSKDCLKLDGLPGSSSYLITRGMVYDLFFLPYLNFSALHNLENNTKARYIQQNIISFHEQ